MRTISSLRTTAVAVVCSAVLVPSAAQARPAEEHWSASRQADTTIVPAPAPAAAASAQNHGFDWPSAGIGAGILTVAGLGAAGAATTVGRRRRAGV